MCYWRNNLAIKIHILQALEFNEICKQIKKVLIQIHYFWQMKNIVCVFLFLISFNAVAQKYADTSYYLVDSLSIDALGKQDVKLLDSCLKVYHASNQDTTRIKTLTFLIEEMASNDWI